MPVAPGVALLAGSALSANLIIPFATRKSFTLTMIGFPIRRVGKLPVAWQKLTRQMSENPGPSEGLADVGEMRRMRRRSFRRRRVLR
jgi:hypothetical protein